MEVESSFFKRCRSLGGFGGLAGAVSSIGERCSYKNQQNPLIVGSSDGSCKRGRSLSAATMGQFQSTRPGRARLHSEPDIPSIWGVRFHILKEVYPRDIYAFGLVAWTGNDVLNRRLRLLAESKGYRLDDTGLYLATQSSGGKKGAKSSSSIRCKTEREVFDLLGFPWLEPHQRNL